jgi:hypothetical protein
LHLYLVAAYLASSPIILQSRVVSLFSSRIEEGQARKKERKKERKRK